MEKETITLLAQILTAMKDSISQLERAQKNKDLEKIAQSKAEIMNLKNQIDRLL